MGLFRGDRTSDIERELRHHVRECAEHLMTRGMPPDAAWAEAARRFGDMDAVRRELDAIDRRGRVRRALEESVRSLGADLRFVLRSLLRRPGFVVAVAATLALGIGAATSIFSVLDAVILRPLAYEDAHRWTEVYSGTPERSYLSHELQRFDGWRELGGSFADAWVGFNGRTLVRVDGARPEPLRVTAVTPGAFDLLGIPLLVGRGFLAGDARPGGPDVVVLARGYWERLGGDPDVLGRTIELETGPATVVGVLRGGVKFPDYGRPADVWMPIRDDFTVAGRELRAMQGVWARRLPGLSVEQAQARADRTAASLEEVRPLGDRTVTHLGEARRLEGRWSIVLKPLGQHRAAGDLRQGLWVLAATVGVLLLIAVVNGVNLLLVRSTARAREFAVRASLGCSRYRLARQLLVEGTALGLAGAAGAVGLAWVGVQAMGPILPSGLTYFSPHAVRVEGRTLAFAFSAALAAGTVLGLVPALAGVRMEALSAGRSGGDAPGRHRVRKGLVAGQIALSLTLLATAGLLARSLAKLLEVDPGFDVQRVATMEFQLPADRYPSAAERADFLRRLEERLEATPGVRAVAVSAGSGFMAGGALRTEAGGPPEGQPVMIPHTSVGPDYIETLGLELVEGRAFDRADRARGPDVAIVDEDLATFLWGDAPAVGRRFRVGEGKWREVVGVVRELRLMGRDERQGPHQILFSLSEDGPGSYVHVAIRSAGDPSGSLPRARAAVAELDPWLPILHLRTAASALAEEEAQPRFLLLLVTLLATTAVILAGVGLYGVLSYAVRTRERELGVRMALGAGRPRVMARVLGEGLGIAAAGVAVGLAGALLAARLVEGLLYEIEPHDPVALGGSALLFLAIAAAAAYFPARRATGIPPADALRAD